jgi:RNA polymerase sigma-70 factor (ECF subfamily)
MENDEARLWALARGGDALAFAAVFDLHRDRVFRQAVRLLESWPDAEDVSASAFLELFRRRDDVRIVNGSVLPWLLVTTANLARNATRARRRYRDFLARLPRDGREPGSADAGLSVVDLDLDPRLHRALRQLSEEDVALLTLVALDDFTIADAAEVLGLSPAGAKTRLHRARQRIRKTLPDFLVAYDQTGAP